MKIIPVILLLCLSFCFTGTINAQSKKSKRLQEDQRKKFALSNYYISMNMNALLTGYSGLIERKLDSVAVTEKSPTIRSKQIFLKSTLLTSLAQASFHSDPLAAAIDSWSYSYQLIDYFGTKECNDIYGKACPEMEGVFRQLATNYENGLSEYLSAEDLDGLRRFAANHPIRDEYLNRRSIIYEISEWISSNQLGLKTGLLSMTDLMRDLSNQLEYYSATLPKQTLWQMDMRLGELQPDSLLTLVGDMQRLLHASTILMEHTDEIIRDNRDTLLSGIDYQRKATLALMQREREAILDAMSLERQAVMDALHSEREEAQVFVDQQRQALIGDVNTLSNDMVSLSIASAKEMVDYVFFKLFILTGILGVVILLGIVAYKRL